MRVLLGDPGAELDVGAHRLAEALVLGKFGLIERLHVELDEPRPLLVRDLQLSMHPDQAGKAQLAAEAILPFRASRLRCARFGPQMRDRHHPRNALRRVFRHPSMLGTSRLFRLAKVRRRASSHWRAARRLPRRYRALRRRTPSRATRTSPRYRYPGTAAGCPPRTSATADSRPSPFARLPLPWRCVRSGDGDRQLAYVVIAQGVMCGWDLIEGELACDVHVERPVTDERRKPFKELRIGLAVERLRFDVRCRGRFRLYAGGVSRPPARPYRRHSRVGLWSSDGEERGVN